MPRLQEMTPTQIDLVRENWEAVAPLGDGAAERFLGILFSLDPEVRPLFDSARLRHQAHQLMEVTGTVVGLLDRLEDLRPTLNALGRRHVGYGVEDRHFASMCLALLHALEETLGPRFTNAHRDAWVRAFGNLAVVMMRAGDEESAA